MLFRSAKAMAAKIISKGSYAVSIAKAAINNGYDMDIQNAVEMEANLFGITCSTNDKKDLVFPTRFPIKFLKNFLKILKLLNLKKALSNRQCL